MKKTGFFVNKKLPSVILYIIGKCKGTPYYYITLGKCTEDGKFAVHIAEINMIDSYAFIDIADKDKIKKKHNDLVLSIQNFKRKIQVELIPYMFGIDIPSSISDIEYELVNLGMLEELNLAFCENLYKPVENIAFQNSSHTKYGLFYVCLLDNYLKNRLKPEKYMRYIETVYEIASKLPIDDVNEYKKTISCSVSVIEHYIKNQKEDSYDFYAVQVMKLLLEYPYIDKTHTDYYKELAYDLFMLEKIRKESKEINYYTSIDVWKEIEKKQLLVQIINIMLDDQEQYLMDEILFRILFRYLFKYDIIEDTKFWNSLFEIKIDFRFPMSKLLMQVGKNRFDFECGYYEIAGKEILNIYEIVKNEWDILDKRFEDKTILKELGSSVIKVLYNMGYYDEVVQFYEKYRDVKWKGLIYTSADFGHKIMKYSNDELYNGLDKDVLYKQLCFFGEHMPKVKQLCELGNSKKIIYAVLDMIRIYETSELISRRLTVHSGDDILKNVGYYTSFKVLRYVLQDDEHRLTIMNACYMNDMEEGYVLPEFLEISRKNSVTAGVYLKSLQLTDETIMMWNLYGDGGKGCFVNVDSEFFKELNQSDCAFKLYRIVYISEQNQFKVAGDKDGELSKMIEELCKKNQSYIKNVMKYAGESDEMSNIIIDSVNDAIRLIRYLFKRDIFETEQEVRILYEDSGKYPIQELKVEGEPCERKALKLPVSLRIKNVILGPKFDDMMQAVPYIAYKSCEMQTKETDRSNFLREGVKYSKFCGKYV